MSAATLTGIACGHCKGRHETVAQVRLCSERNRRSVRPTEATELRPAPVTVTQVAPVPEIPVGDRRTGHFALRTDEGGGGVRFYRVDRPDQGKWAGATFVKVQAGDQYHKLYGAYARKVIAEIAADPLAAAALYGAELERCAMCNRTLTNDESRARGIGPDCWGKM